MTHTPENIDLDNAEFQTAWQLITHTRQSLFLTGKAGTGKSTFLRYICRNTKKKYVVLAPTGVAAVNVGGMTMHSFFKMPFKPLLPDDPDFAPRRIKKTLRYPREKVRLLKELDMIIVDEISMVRSDMIDFMDRVLRAYSGNMREPFGGKQLLLVGDIFQLEPVVPADMRDILRRQYRSFFFFNAFAFGNVKLVPIELKKIYRQSDSYFVEMLDRVRVNRATRDDIKLINSRCNPDYRAGDGQFVMTLATRRDTVDMINEAHIEAIKEPQYVFEGEIEGVFPAQNLPTSKELILKKGAQVIFIRNDKEKRWINGTLGRVTALAEDDIEVELENGEVYRLEPEVWENMQYSYNEEKKAVEETVLGSFRQYPVKPAWALTVHKCQGLTFNNVIIDFAGGAFSSGQTYVALSRCTTLEGMVLLKPIDERDIIVNQTVVEFSRSFNDLQIINDAMNRAAARALYKEAVRAFDSNDFRRAVGKYAEAALIDNEINTPLVQRYIASKLSKILKLEQDKHMLEQVVDAQQQMLQKLAMEYASMGMDSLEMATEGTLCRESGASYGDKHPGGVELSAAMANFNKALDIWPKCVSALVGKAWLMHLLGEDSEALRLLDEAGVADGQSYDVYLTRGRVMMAMDDLAGAVKAMKSAVKCDKTRPEPHDCLAEMYGKLGLEDYAERHEQKAARLRCRRKGK